MVPRRSSMTDLLSSVVDVPTMAESVEQITAFAAETFGTPHAGVTLVHERGKRFESAGPTDDIVRRADELQDELDEGPCLEAATVTRFVVSNDLASDLRWPAWGPRAAALGLGSVLSSEVHVGTRRAGALNVYGDRGREFTRTDIETAQVLAAHAAVALAFAEKIEGLTIALDSRTTIGQAQGILMHRYGIDADRAFALLKRFSQTENIKLAQVAQRVIDETVRA